MQGYNSSSQNDTFPMRRAHKTSGPKVNIRGLWTRAMREEQEDKLLSFGATRSIFAKREHYESSDDIRTPFEKDRDRIVDACNAFKRLSRKAQVFVLPSDHIHTRLTHTLEVAQIATAISRATRLNVALTEAIALGHDCGHGPGGHISEVALSPYIKGGFNHALWGADVILKPLNLCEQTLDGIRNHSWSRPACATVEGEVVSWADRIAYCCHDFEDAVKGGLLSTNMLPSSIRQVCGTTKGHQIDRFISGVIRTLESRGEVGMDEEAAQALAEFRKFNYEHIYSSPIAVEQGKILEKVLKNLVEYFGQHPGLINTRPNSNSQGLDIEPNSTKALNAALTYVAGMTDIFLLATAKFYLGWKL